LDRGYSLPPVNFSPREAAILVVLGRFAAEMRLIPFVETLDGALSKVRGALTAGQQREALAHAEKLVFVGVPAQPCAPAIRRVVEEAWFEQRPMRVAYRRSDSSSNERTVRILRVLMERTMTVLECSDVATGEVRGVRLDRIDRATIVNEG
jgi:predicted DNA-binding transcriptional regulator YafY